MRRGRRRARRRLRGPARGRPARVIYDLVLGPHEPVSGGAVTTRRPSPSGRSATTTSRPSSSCCPPRWPAGRRASGPQAFLGWKHRRQPVRTLTRRWSPITTAGSSAYVSSCAGSCAPATGRCGRCGGRHRHPPRLPRARDLPPLTTGAPSSWLARTPTWSSTRPTRQPPRLPPDGLAAWWASSTDQPRCGRCASRGVAGAALGAAGHRQTFDSSTPLPAVADVLDDGDDVARPAHRPGEHRRLSRDCTDAASATCGGAT